MRIQNKKNTKKLNEIYLPLPFCRGMERNIFLFRLIVQHNVEIHPLLRKYLYMQIEKLWWQINLTTVKNIQKKNEKRWNNIYELNVKGINYKYLLYKMTSSTYIQQNFPIISFKQTNKQFFVVESLRRFDEIVKAGLGFCFQSYSVRFHGDKQKLRNLRFSSQLFESLWRIHYLRYYENLNIFLADYSWRNAFFAKK